MDSANRPKVYPPDTLVQWMLYSILPSRADRCNATATARDAVCGEKLQPASQSDTVVGAVAGSD